MYYESMIPFVNLLYVYGSYQRERRKWRWCGCFGHMTWTGDLCFASTALGATRMTPVTKVSSTRSGETGVSSFMMLLMISCWW